MPPPPAIAEPMERFERNRASYQARLARQADVIDWRIDELVYELYELTDAEIAIVEADGG